MVSKKTCTIEITVIKKIHAVMIASDKGMKLIAGFSILVESSGNCQQSAGSFDQLDSQWNITQCVHEQVRLSS